jgi:crossover junction endodeoxyribonuclease RuvC
MKINIQVGIDPGLGGAIVALCGGQPVEWMAMPTMKAGASSRVNGAELAAFLRSCNASHVFVEQVGAMPGQGVTSMFTFGHAAGVVAGVVAAIELPLTLVTPQAWKKRAGLSGTEKDAARVRAIQLWPIWRDLGTKVQGQALADAALIARFGGGAC